jgi:hypothetical protein
MKKMTDRAINKKTGELLMVPVEHIGTRNRVSVKNRHGNWYQYAVSSLQFLSSWEAYIVEEAQSILRGKKKRTACDKEILSSYSMIVD